MAKRPAPAPARSVDEFLTACDHPLMGEVRELRRIILKACPSREESIKWNAPNFALAGEDRLTFNLRAQDEVRLILHRGARAKERDLRSALSADVAGLVEWAAGDRAIASFASAAEVREQRALIGRLVTEWLEATA